MPISFTYDITDVSQSKIAMADPATLDRWSDILVSQVFERQGSRLAAIAAERRAVAS
jgi:hypothetical protein